MRLAESLLPPDPPVAARWSVAVMELGALVCTARTPRCADCPITRECAWRLAGKPALRRPAAQAARRTRAPTASAGAACSPSSATRPAPVEKAALDDVWDDTLQRERALAALIEDGLVDPLDDGRYALPS